MIPRSLPRLEVPRQNPDAVVVGKNIRSLRHQRGWTQVDLAKKLGASRQSVVGNYEKGWSCPSIPVLRKLAEVFGVSIDVIVIGERAPADHITDKALYECFRKAEQLDFRSRFIIQEFVEGQLARAQLEQQEKKAAK